ncbi:hypothetical protein GGS23DRAFT_589097 [Durotheca rogersii]|uniref:uncharacterized protein n=1 Tax=Durotheca rogersii TaxID=419775 RepID=UPI00221ED9E7|nr:uncharacterized protein GGS23DRAFT_589097 [Durotheca rogersii]KAI5856179.1 hypothetical protein GGS23DRAFT_589097 [Durotheca rogersii]
MQTEASFFSLPREVRDRIYEFYLAPDYTDFGDTLRPQLIYLDGPPYQRPLPTLMLSCKRLYRELHSMVHRQAAIRVIMHGWNERRIGFAVHGTLRLDRLEKLWFLVAMERPNWNRWLPFFGKLTLIATKLEVLVIDWEPRPVTSAGWTGRVNTKKEDEFFQALASLKQLRLIQVHGDVTPRWREQLEKVGPHVVYHHFRWWREPGIDH